jgi:signal transduction histidine kinase/DNA-binding response OmpR family regulator
VLLLLLGSCQNTDPSPVVPGSVPPVAVLQKGQTNYKLQTFTQVLADSAGKYKLDDVLEPARQSEFLLYKEYPLPMQNYQYYWGKIQVENRLPEADQYPEWAFSFSDTWSVLEVYLPTKDGNWVRHTSGAFTPYGQKKFVPTTRGNLVKIILPPGEVVTVYFRGISEQEEIIPSFNLFAQPLDDFYDKLVIDKTANSIFIGFLLMMLFYNLIVYFFDRDRSFIFYSGYILAVVLYVSFSSNDLTDLLGNVLFTQHPAYYGLFKLVLFGGLMCYLAFIRSFLDLEQLLPKWDRYFKYLIYLGVPLIALSIVLSVYSNFSYKVEDKASMFYVGLVALSCLMFILPLYKTGDIKGRFVVAGVAIITLGFLLTLLSRLSPGTPYSIFYLQIGAVVEVIVFSLGLAYRQRQQVQAGEQANFALKESQLIQEKKQMEADRLKELNEFKARFYTNITHEFRTPLTVIMGMSEHIKDHQKEKTLIKRNSANLLRLINQLLDLSKLESGGLTMNPIHQDIIVYLQYLTESFYSNAAQKNIRLVFHSEEKEVCMDYDEGVVQQIVYNLLSNALKFTTEGGKIIFHASKIEEKGQPLLKLKVKDTGLGISPENIDHIFDRFYQVNHADNREAEGTGIGLALTKELVELMNGRIEVESEKGVGTEFTLYLPIEAKIAATSQQPANALLPIEEASTLATSTTSQDEASEAVAPGLPELLIIEDNQDIITYIKTVLHGQYLFHTAKNGALGIEKALDIIPDIIISDVMMPEKNGYEVCETLKQDVRTSHVPIILLTAKSTQEDKLQGLKYGADAYLIKPFDKQELMVRLEKLVEVRQQLQKRYANVSAIMEEAQQTPPSREDVFLQKLHEHIHDNLSDAEFGVPQLAEVALLSQMQLYRKLKALTDRTPSQFIRSYRLQQGLVLLERGELNVSEVAYEVGFTDPNYFSRTFQKEFKRNPSSFLSS